MKDYYGILGVDKNASPDEIKKAYRKLSKQFHPDVNPEGAERFKEIAEAYDTLSNPDKKQKYDNPMSNMFTSRQAKRLNWSRPSLTCTSNTARTKAF